VLILGNELSLLININSIENQPAGSAAVSALDRESMGEVKERLLFSPSAHC